MPEYSGLPSLSRLYHTPATVMKTSLAILLCFASIGFFSYRIIQQRAETTQASETTHSGPVATTESDGAFNPMQVVPPFDPIVDAPMMQAKEVNDEVLPLELVLGLELNGSARAYPINMLTGPQREIINDTLGGIPIAATW